MANSTSSRLKVIGYVQIDSSRLATETRKILEISRLAATCNCSLYSSGILNLAVAEARSI